MVQLGIVGSYGGLNMGDEAILEAMLAQIRRELEAGITVVSYDPEDTRRRHGVDAVATAELTRAELRAVIERLDLLVVGGGGILFDEAAEYYLRHIELAHELGVPVMIYAISAGPLTRTQLRERARDLLGRCAVVSVRDRFALQLLEEIGVEHVELTADPALLLEPRPLPESVLRGEGLADPRPLIGFSVREPGPAAPEIDPVHYHVLLADAADFLIERVGAQVVFIPLERLNRDIQHSHAVVARMRNAKYATVLRGDYDPAELVGLARHFDFAVGMRLHFLIFAALAGVPFVALPYAPKVRGFLDDLGLPAPALADVTAGQLAASIDRAWDSHREICERIRERLPGLQERARRTHRLLLRLVRRIGG